MDPTERGNPNVCPDCIRWIENTPPAPLGQKKRLKNLPGVSVDFPITRQGRLDFGEASDS